MSAALSPPAVSLPSSARLGLIAGLSAAAIWGAYLALSRVGVAAGLDGFDVAALRYLVAGPVMLAILLMRRDGARPRMTAVQAITVSVLLGPPEGKARVSTHDRRERDTGRSRHDCGIGGGSVRKRDNR